MQALDGYQPPVLLKNPHLQTILASSKIRILGANPMRAAADEQIIETTGGIKLLGYHSAQKNRQPKGLAVLLSGWEGSADSTYILRCGKILYHHGYDVFRLNYRDHGPSHHLNTGIFYAVLLDEVHHAISQVTALAGYRPMFLVGFSLGGNFVLRLLRKWSQTPIANLRHAVSISPVLNPQKSTETIDRIAFIRKYFLAKWRRSLLKKQALFPDLYDFSAVLRLKSIQAVTDFLLEKYSDYKSAREYFDAYAFMGAAAEDITIPATVITAADDPIIPVSDFYNLSPNRDVDLIIHPHGGHNGFIAGYKLQSWYEQLMVRQFDRIVKQTG